MIKTESVFTQRFVEHAIQSSESRCLHYKGKDYSYGEIEYCSRLLAKELVLSKFSSGARVLLVMRNCPEYVVSYLGILRAGCVAVALNHQLSQEEISAIAADCQPEAMILEADRVRELAQVARAVPSIRQVFSVADPEVMRVLGEQEQSGIQDQQELPALPPDSFAQIIYTSGTTGRPKGVVLTHANLTSNCNSIIEYLRLTSDDSVLVVLPFFYSYGNSLLFTHLACGGCLVLATDSVFWSRNTSLMIEQKVTGFAGVPSTYSLLLHKSDFTKKDFPFLRYLTCAGGRLPPAHAEKVQSAVPHASLFLMYGQTEATARLSTLYPQELPAKLGSIGKGIPGVTLTVLDDNGDPVAPNQVGEVVANGPNIMSGYWNDTSMTKTVLRPTGLHTGDLAYIDNDGYIYIVGRKDDMIKSGGHRIYPSELEDIISRVPGVAEAVVVGIPDTLLYERPVAVVVPEIAASSIDHDQILDLCAKRLPPHKRPHTVLISQSLPKTSSGKVKRKEVAREVIESMLSEGASSITQSDKFITLTQ